MIKSFGNEISRKIFEGEKLSGKELRTLGDFRIEKAQERLHVLNLACENDLLKLQSLHYHRLHGSKRYSIDANSRNSKWRITFEWYNHEMRDVSLVRIEDTH